MIKKIAEIAIKKNKTIAVAESCTGGLISNSLTDISGSSKYFKLGIIAYSNQAKSSILRIPPKEINRFGAVSRQVSSKMAINVKALLKTDIGLSCSGIAGPIGGTRQKPVGTVYIAIASDSGVHAKKFNFKGNRFQIKNQTRNKALQILKTCLENM